MNREIGLHYPKAAGSENENMEADRFLWTEKSVCIFLKLPVIGRQTEVKRSESIL